MVVEWFADGIAATGPERSAGILTYAAEAGLVGRAALVRPATECALVSLADVTKRTARVSFALLGRSGWHRSALDPGVPHVSPLAGAHWLMRRHGTQGIGATGSGQEAQVFAFAAMTSLRWQALLVRSAPVSTLAVFADLSKGAVLVLPTTLFYFSDAVHMRIAREAREADAHRSVIGGAAVRVDAADAGKTAGVLAPIADAGLVVRTGVVRATGVDAIALLADASQGAVAVVEAEVLHGDGTFGVGVADEAQRTGADGLVVDG